MLFSVIRDKIFELIITRMQDKDRNISQEERVQQAYKKLKLQSVRSATRFNDLYAYALVQFIIDKPLTMFFILMREDILCMVRNAWNTHDFSELIKSVDALIECNEKQIDQSLPVDILKFYFRQFITLFQQITNERRNMLVSDAKSWFQSLSYRIEEGELESARFHAFIIQRPAEFSDNFRILIHCSEQEVEVKDLENLQQAVSENNTDIGWFIVLEKQNAKTVMQNNIPSSITCCTIDDLLYQGSYFDSYFDWLDMTIMEKKIETRYINLGWFDYLDEWQEDSTSEQIAFLGDIGSGKTWFALYYAYKCLQRYRTSLTKPGTTCRIPIYIHVNRHVRYLTLESLIAEFFHRHTITSLPYSTVEYLNRSGNLLFLIDDFDNLLDTEDIKIRLNNFLEFTKFVVPNSKIILMCRKGSFPTVKTDDVLFEPEIKNYLSLSNHEIPRFSVIEFIEVDISNVFDSLHDQLDPDIVRKLERLYRIQRLISRPGFIELVVDCLATHGSEIACDDSTLLFHTVLHYLRSRKNHNRVLTSTAERLFFLCEFAWELQISKAKYMHFRSFPDGLYSCFKGYRHTVETDDFWQDELRENILISGTIDGEYEISQIVLLTFFVALKVAFSLGVVPDGYLQPIRSQSPALIIPESEAVDYTWTDWFTHDLDENQIPIPKKPLQNLLPDNCDYLLNALWELPEKGMNRVDIINQLCKIINNSGSALHFYQMLSQYIDEYNSGVRDIRTNKTLLHSIMCIRVESQLSEQEQQSTQQVRSFWRSHLEKEQATVQHLVRNEDITIKNPVGDTYIFKMVRIPAGTFLMGWEYSSSINRVTLTTPFLISQFQVTQELFTMIMQSNPSEFQGKMHPVEHLTWIEAIAFCNKLSEMSRLAPAYSIKDEKVIWNKHSDGFRLPTEAEWEYACRAGTTTHFANGDIVECCLEEIGWYRENCEHTSPVGQKKSNAWGLFDMHGNVDEWCWDWYAEYEASPLVNPSGPDSGLERIARGGSWLGCGFDCTSAYRGSYNPSYRLPGLRLVRSIL